MYVFGKLFKRHFGWVGTTLYLVCFYLDSWSNSSFLQFLYDLKMLPGARAARAWCVLVMKTLTTCTLSILVSNLFLDRKRNISIHWYLSCLHEIDGFFCCCFNLIGRKKQFNIWSPISVCMSWRINNVYHFFRFQKSLSTEELTAEMANLEGLMKDLNAITQQDFEV